MLAHTTHVLTVTALPNKTSKMMKIIILLAAFVAMASAKPGLVSAPLVAAAPAVVTASSSQYYHRINSGLAAYVAAPAAYVAPAAAPYFAASYAAPYVSAPYIAAPAPIVAV